MDHKQKKILQNIAGVLLLLGLTYLAIVNNLFKSTGRYDWNPLNSEALSQFLIFTAIAVPIIIVVRRFINKRKS